jgi:hypothetical protein
MLTRVGEPVRRTAVAVLLLAGIALAGCSDSDGGKGGDCTGSAYQPDLSEKGARSPIVALEDWLGTDPKLPDPPDDGWTVQDSGAKAPDLVVIRNDADGDGEDDWWVGVVRTDDGGWVVEQATDDASGCSDLPTG